MKTKSNFFHSLFVATVIIGLVALVFSGCPNSSASDETITVKLINAGDGNGKNFYFNVYNEGESNAAKDDPVAWGVDQILSATAEDVAEDDNGDVIFTGGEKYDIYALVDLDDSGPEAATSGDMRGGPFTVEVDGNTTITLDYGEFTDYGIYP